MSRSIGKASKDLLHHIKYDGTHDFIKKAPGNVESIIVDGMSRATCLWGCTDAEREESEASLTAEINRAICSCDSPIEKDMLAALSTAHWGLYGRSHPEIHVFEKGVDEYPKGPVVIIPQFKISRFRLDFAVIFKTARGKRISAVECDGREYHDPVKDMERDLYLSCLGIKTYRATGAQIIKDPISVSNKIVQQITLGKSYDEITSLV